MEDNHLVEQWPDVASKLWLRDTPATKASPEIIEREIWNPLDKASFPLRSLTTLESLQFLEKSVDLTL